VVHEEADLISQCQMGDQAAMKEIFDKYRDKVYRVAYGVVRHREEAMDIVQEVFVKLFLTIGNFKGKSSFYTYIYRTNGVAVFWLRVTKTTMDWNSNWFYWHFDYHGL
jgi:RNA polymerase sigma-70 factor (ECF subfamily)